METETGEKTPQTEEIKISSAEQTLPNEEPIILKKLYPHAKQDLDALFPEPNLKKLLKDLVCTRQKNERFLKRVKLGAIHLEEEDESAEPP
jgi:hypothetical protein